MGFYRSLREAPDSPRPIASWKERVIYRVTLPDGREFFRTSTFDHYAHKCKRCRHAFRRVSEKRWRVACTGHVCETCGNPYAAFTRKYVRHLGQGEFVVTRAWSSNGRAH